MRLFATAMLLVSIVILGAGNAKVHAQSNNVKTTKQTSSKEIVVKSGDTLTDIGKKFNTPYQRIFYANTEVKNPNMILVGEKLRIPNKDEKLKPRPLGITTTNVVQYSVQTSYNGATNQTYKAVSYPAPSNGGVWDNIAQCESGGNWGTNTGNGYYGGLQFTPSSWHAVGGSGLPSQASRSEQIARAKILQSRQGWGAWPACTSKLGIR